MIIVEMVEWMVAKYEIQKTRKNLKQHLKKKKIMEKYYLNYQEIICKENACIVDIVHHVQ